MTTLSTTAWTGIAPPLHGNTTTYLTSNLTRVRRRVLAEQLQKHWGKITPEIAISEIIAKTMTGQRANSIFHEKLHDKHVIFSSQYFTLVNKQFDPFPQATFTMPSTI